MHRIQASIFAPTIALTGSLLLLGCLDLSQGSGSDGAGGEGGGNLGGQGGDGTDTATYTNSATITNTGSDTSLCGTTQPDPCCSPFALPPEDCPTEFPTGACDTPNGYCSYGENCGAYPNLTAVKAFCKYETGMWRRVEPGVPFCPDPFSRIDKACPCTPPVVGTSCSFSVISQESPCSYGPCETYTCDNMMDSVWVLEACE